MVSLIPPIDPVRNETPDVFCPTVGTNCRGIVNYDKHGGAIWPDRELGMNLGDSGDGLGTSLPSLESHSGGEILCAAIIHYKATTPITMRLCLALKRPVVQLIKTAKTRAYRSPTAKSSTRIWLGPFLET